MGCIVSTLAFPVPPENRALLEELSLHPDYFVLETADGTEVSALHLRRGYSRTLLYSHGNCQDLSTMAEGLELMTGFCRADILAYDYCGYGLSEGSASELGCYAAINAAYEYLSDLSGSPSMIVAFGESIGSGPTVDLASRHPDVAGVVLLMPFESAVRTVKACGQPLSRLFRCIDIFRNYEKIDRVACPVLVMHGTADQVVPFEHGLSLYRNCRRPVEPLWVAGCDHDDMPWEACMRRIRQFMDELEAVGKRADVAEHRPAERGRPVAPAAAAALLQALAGALPLPRSVPAAQRPPTATVGGDGPLRVPPSQPSRSSRADISGEVPWPRPPPSQASQRPPGQDVAAAGAKSACLQSGDHFAILLSSQSAAT